ncbi:MAG TPA: tetratricopeptide repeat protein, partial [Thermodesulfobacteriota bacterium]|nr:tetratricopeptide repeat protein [Thermodesulfobacteriota bacterium]
TPEATGCLDTLESLGLVELLDEPRAAAPLPAYPRRPVGLRFVPPPPGSGVEKDFVDLAGELAEEVGGELAGLADAAGRAAARPAAAGVDAAERAEREAALRAEHEGLARKTYYELFGLTPATYRYEALKEAYFAKLERFSPDYFAQSGSPGAVVAMAEEVVAKLANAYMTLSNVVSKENYDRLLAERAVAGTGNKEEDALQAEVQYQSGLAFLEQKDFEAAERALTMALNLEARPEGYAHLAWAVFNNPRNPRGRSTLERAKSLLTRSLSLGPTADAYAYRGAILLAEGKPGLAEADFQKALRLAPTHRLARRELAALEARRAEAERGFFRRLFR